MTRGLLVVGVGRSGTSIATRLAGSLGLRLPRSPDLLPGNASNPDGHWESASLAELNDRLLARIDSTWWTPPAVVSPELVATLAPLCTDAIRAFEDVFGTSDGWLWKDPRLTVTLPFWSDLIDAGRVLYPHRQPQAVAKSIAARDGLSYLQGLAIWERHTRLSLTACSNRSVAISSFELLASDPERWTRNLAEFARQVDLPVHAPRGNYLTFVRRAPEPVSGWVSPQQKVLSTLLRDLGGNHQKFRLPTPLPDESPWVGETLAQLPLPAWFHPPT